MARGLWEKIEWVREQPEHIRMRYVIGSLVVSMVFIFGIWLLSLTENFHSIGQGLPAVTEKSKGLLPKNDIPSLNSLMDQTKPLQVDGQDQKTGKEYFDEQFQSGTQGADEGVPNQQSTP